MNKTYMPKSFINWQQAYQQGLGLAKGASPSQDDKSRFEFYWKVLTFSVW